ncbi:hypothetical protein BDFB_002213 [Asbolus verrucosus]|uniref:Uncharacterized protein n=1 Tax=Asbolus verrucosus TaxID=1661398 RepID=A0A482W1P1_ASBVE|nr:hypothetical protein BDFB_002213 [Asbolus verrucosus]
MNVQKHILESSREHFNATEQILYSLDKLILKTTTEQSTSLPSLFIYTHVSKEEVGAMVIHSGPTEDFTSFQAIPLHNDSCDDQLKNTNFEVAFRVPLSLAKNYDPYIVIVFGNDRLFVQKSYNNNNLIGKWITRVLIPDASDVSTKIQVYFKKIGCCNIAQSCRFWNRNFWSKINSVKLQYGPDMWQCEYARPGHFVFSHSKKLVVGDSKRTFNLMVIDLNDIALMMELRIEFKTNVHIKV